MRIAQVAPLYESVPPKYYGGTERVVSHLTEELVRQGYEVTLFASGDSATKAHLVAACPRSLRLDKHCMDQLSHQILMLEHVFQRAAEFDVLSKIVNQVPVRCIVPHADPARLSALCDLIIEDAMTVTSAASARTSVPQHSLNG